MVMVHLTMTTQSCDTVPKLGQLTQTRTFSMNCQISFDHFLGIFLGLLLEFRIVLKSIVKNTDTSQCFPFKSQKHTCVPELFSSLCQMLC